MAKKESPWTPYVAVVYCNGWVDGRTSLAFKGSSYTFNPETGRVGLTINTKGGPKGDSLAFTLPAGRRIVDDGSGVTTIDRPHIKLLSNGEVWVLGYDGTETVRMDMMFYVGN